MFVGYDYEESYVPAVGLEQEEQQEEEDIQPPSAEKMLKLMRKKIIGKGLREI